MTSKPSDRNNTRDGTRRDAASHDDVVEVVIYVSDHCMVCDYADEVAATIRRDFPQVAVRLVDLSTATEPIPESIFATPTYFLNGRLWSLGNPSPEQVARELTALVMTATSS